MSLRVDTSPLISGALVIGNRGLGVLGSSVPSTGDNGAGYLYNDLSLPADANKEVRGLILTQPSAGTLYAYEDSSFEFTGAPDGTYTFTYRLYVDGADTGVGTVNLQVGSPVAAVSATTSLPAFSGSAGQSASCAISVTTALPTFSGSASVDGTPATVTVSATTALPVFTGSAAVDNPPVQATIAAQTQLPAFMGSAQSGAAVTITASTTKPTFSGSASVAVSALVTISTTTAKPTFNGSAASVSFGTDQVVFSSSIHLSYRAVSPI